MTQPYLRNVDRVIFMGQVGGFECKFNNLQDKYLQHLQYLQSNNKHIFCIILNALAYYKVDLCLKKNLGVPSQICQLTVTAHKTTKWNS